MVQAKEKLAFVFWDYTADPKKHRTTVSTDTLDFIMVGVKDMDQTVKVCQDLAREGVQVIELCGGYGNIGVGKVAEAVKGVPVGVVKFDIHPLLQGKGGDQIFGLNT